MQTPKRKRYQKDTAPADDIITLIHLVRQNPALYNYKLQPNQRRRIDVLNGWAQIAAQIGNKYTVEECRRKWKNLRDTYHQYRLRKPKLGDGLSKWRYAKELDFLSNVYQPKLKSHRQQHQHHYDVNEQTVNLLQNVHEATVLHTEEHEDDSKHTVHGDEHEMVHHAGITLVNDDAETFILTAYEDVNDEMAHAAAHMELGSHHDVEDVTEIVKNEHTNSLDDGDDGATAEVDYEEVCLYEEAANAPSVDCETIIAGAGDVTGGASVSPSSTEVKAFHYIDDSDFCIESISATHAQLTSVPTTTNNSNSALKFACAGVKVKNLTAGTVCNSASPTNVSVFSTAPLSSVMLDNITTIAPTVVTNNSHAPSHTPPAMSTNFGQREELDLFFDFLKKKMQHFSKEEITAIQVEFLNCVLRREAESAQKQHDTLTGTTL